MERNNEQHLWREDNDSCEMDNSYYAQPGGDNEEHGFTQPSEYKDENGAGGSLGESQHSPDEGKEQTDDERYGNDNPGGAGSAGSAATNQPDTNLL